MSPHLNALKSSVVGVDALLVEVVLNAHIDLAQIDTLGLKNELRADLLPQKLTNLCKEPEDHQSRIDEGTVNLVTCEALNIHKGKVER